MNDAPAKMTADACPQLPSYVKLHHDTARERWVLLAPERILETDETALEIVRLCDGKTSVNSMAEHLSKKYDAPAQQILTDITDMLQNLLDRRFLEIGK